MFQVSSSWRAEISKREINVVCDKTTLTKMDMPRFMGEECHECCEAAYLEQNTDPQIHERLREVNHALPVEEGKID